jgi:hypothetical protein
MDLYPATGAFRLVPEQVFRVAAASEGVGVRMFEQEKRRGAFPPRDFGGEFCL